MIRKNILEAVGHTPLIRLNRLCPAGSADIYVKYEAVNAGGSIKTRVALAMIEDAEKKGLLRPDSIVVEPTSGNQGVGLALCCAVKGYRAVIIMPDSVSEERRKLVRQYGAEVRLIHDDGDIGACIDTCIRTARSMAREDPRVFLPQQFENPANPMIHKTATAAEILADMDEAGLAIHGFCSGFGTGGTLTGIGEALRERYPKLQIWIPEPEHAALLSGGTVSTHLQMGIGDGLIPAVMNTALHDRLMTVSDETALHYARELARQEGLLCGISSGTNVACAIEMAKVLGKGKNVVTLLPDTGERYFSTALFDQQP